MRMPKERRRRAELRRTARRLRKLGKRRGPMTNGEDQLNRRVDRHLQAFVHHDTDAGTTAALNEIIESYLTDMKADLLRQRATGDAELDALQATLDALILQYDYVDETRRGRIQHLEYQERAALRGVEDRDTPMPAGADGIEEPGYQHGRVSDLVGGGLVGWVTLRLVLAMTMVADLVTFRQVVERMINSTQVFPLVLALTVATTYVAHTMGESFKRAEEQRRELRRSVAGWLLFGVWAGMGLGAFAFRLLTPGAPVVDAAASYVNAGGATVTSTDGNQTLGAVLLLLLYLLTGAIASTAGYRRPRTEIDQFTRIGRRLRRARVRKGVVWRDLTEAIGLGRQLTNLRDRRTQQYEAELNRCRAAASRVQAKAALYADRTRSAAERTGPPRGTTHSGGPHALSTHPRQPLDQSAEQAPNNG